MIRFLSNQIYQYLQSIQAYIGAPITAVFLTGIFWKRATGKAAIITLIVGGSLGLIRFATDILSKFEYTNFGPFNILTGYAFLNYAVIMFVFAWHAEFGAWVWWAIGLFTLMSATNDIAIDGYTIEMLNKRELGLANGLRIGFYRVGMLASGFAASNSCSRVLKAS